jgi:kinesin family protein 20
MDEDLVKCENKNNAIPRTNLKFPHSEHRNSSVKKEKQVRSKAPTISVNLTTKKREGTL